jgi:Gpi18-like mannosyltransferase
VSFWILSLVAYFAGPSIAPLAVPVAMLTGYLIPGYLLKRKNGYDTI